MNCRMEGTKSIIQNCTIGKGAMGSLGNKEFLWERVEVLGFLLTLGQNDVVLVRDWDFIHTGWALPAKNLSHNIQNKEPTYHNLDSNPTK